MATAAVMVRQHMCQATVFPNQSSSSENYAQLATVEAFGAVDI
ncbi:hypothetical protein HMPREF9607_02599 [Cutibacterium modestum HL044PA1]|uniref:Uncharacterized protein n=1 Tax=Cutibacterium modestum HL044PA1 TaxID=765109 RepID=A0ABN0C2E3_9ACTN|nr:hypothetical protein HMPREF9607_02599 [Cutibacterium modestum HL044PA1]